MAPLMPPRQLPSSSSKGSSPASRAASECASPPLHSLARLRSAHFIRRPSSSAFAALATLRTYCFPDSLQPRGGASARTSAPAAPECLRVSAGGGVPAPWQPPASTRWSRRGARQCCRPGCPPASDIHPVSGRRLPPASVVFDAPSSPYSGGSSSVSSALHHARRTAPTSLLTGHCPPGHRAPDSRGCRPLG